LESHMDEDTVLHSVSNIIAGNLFGNETYNVVDIDVIEE